MNRSLNSSSAFTFLEVIVALAILGGAFVILLGLQSALVERAIVERQQREAMVFAREILSAVEARESAGEPLDIGSYQGSSEDILDALLPGSVATSKVQQDVPLAATYQFELDVQYWGIPNVDEQAMKRVELVVSWGERAPENLQFLLFIPFDEDEVTGIEDDEEDDDDL